MFIYNRAIKKKPLVIYKATLICDADSYTPGFEKDTIFSEMLLLHLKLSFNWLLVVFLYQARLQCQIRECFESLKLVPAKSNNISN